MNKFEEALQALKKGFAHEKEIRVAYVYGSVARGDFSERHSDLDIFMVINKKMVTKKIEERINNIIVPLGLKYGLNVHPEYQGTDIKEEDQTLVKKIIEEGKIFYAAGVFTFTSQQVGLKQYIIYSYSLRDSKNKTMFSKALHGRRSWYYRGKKKIVKEYKGITDNEQIILLGKGCLMIAKDRQKDVEELFKRFNVVYTIVRIVYS